MITIKEYRQVESLEEAWELNQKKSNLVLGGMLWTKMRRKNVQTAIDLSGLGLDQIEENETEIRIGCMVTLRQLELHQGLLQYTNGAIKEAVRHIVGVQFRNLATIGGSIFGRYGFSDVLTLFLAMDASVELYKGGVISMEEFAAMPYDRDLLVRVIVKKTPLQMNYQSVRNTKTDFPVLTCASVLTGEGVYRFAIGARPAKAVLLTDEKGILTGKADASEIAEFAEYAKAQIPTGTNLRGSAEYRTHLIGVLVERGIKKLQEMEASNEN